MVFEKLAFIRVYLKPQNKKPDYDEPMILPAGSTIENLCEKMHTKMKNYFRYAMVWGNSVKHQGQRAGLTHKLSDRDVITIIKKG
jgi:ribosome-interacting GTPase 1